MLSQATDKPIAELPVRMFFIASAIVLGLRIIVGWEYLDQLDEMSHESLGLKLALGLMGVGYLVCGMVAAIRTKSAASGFFALYCLAQAVHWGGPPTVSSEGLQTTLWLAYFTVTMLGISAVLHFTLLFPRPWRLAQHRLIWMFLYLPVLLAGVLAVARMATTGPRGISLESAFMALEALQVNVFGLLATVVIAIRYTRASRSERRASGLGVILAGAVLGQLPYLVASVLAPEAAQAMVFFFFLMPLTITYALLKSDSSRAVVDDL